MKWLSDSGARTRVAVTGPPGSPGGSIAWRPSAEATNSRPEATARSDGSATSATRTVPAAVPSERRTVPDLVLVRRAAEVADADGAGAGAVGLPQLLAEVGGFAAEVDDAADGREEPWVGAGHAAGDVGDVDDRAGGVHAEQ